MDQGPFSLTTHEYIGKLTWVQVDRENTLKAAREGKNPSSAARNFKETQEGDHPIPNGRPDHGLPIGLHHSVFDQFREDVKCTVDDTITAQQYRQIATLIDISMRQYDLQEQRVKRRRSSLRTLLGMAVEVVVTDCGTKSDAVVMVPCGAFLVILEVKNEIGTGGSDPSFQGSLSYRMYWSQDRVSTDNDAKVPLRRHVTVPLGLLRLEIFILAVAVPASSYRLSVRGCAYKAQFS